MQCVWFLTEDAESYVRQNQLSLALKRYQSLWDIFEVWTEDQFDFHSFSLRKGQIRAYIDMLEWENTLRAHPMFVRAALGAIKAYIKLATTPVLAHGSMGNADAARYESMTEAERKRVIKRAKKEAQRAQERAAAHAVLKKEEKNKNAQVADGEVKKEDPDPHGIQLARTETPLEEAARWLKPLLDLASERLETQLAGFEVQLRRRKWSLALECAKKAKELAPQDPRAHELIVRIRHAVNTLPADEDFKAPETKEALLAEAEKLLPKATDLAKYNQEFLDKNKDSAAHIRSGKTRTHACRAAVTWTNVSWTALRIRTILNPEVKDFAPLLSILNSKTVTLEEAVEGLKLLQEFNAEDKAYKEKAAAKFPHPKAFKGSK